VWSLVIETILFSITVVLAMVDSSGWPGTNELIFHKNKNLIAILFQEFSFGQLLQQLFL
jgi:hypothetical protein